MFSHLSNKTILITGASGFIGTHLVRQLLFLTKCKIKIIARNKIDLNDQRLEIFFIKDLFKLNNWSSLLNEVDYIFHLIGVSHYPNKMRNQKDYFYRVNVLLTKNIINAAIQTKVKKIIYLSSIKVNGEYTINNNIFSAKDKPNPQDYYGITKLRAEKEIIKKCEQNSLNYTIIRPPLVYGPRAKGNFGLIIKAVKIGFPLPFKTLKNKRSLISIYNLVDFLIYSIKNKVTDNNIILISDGEDISISELILNIQRQMNKNSIFSMNLFPMPRPFLYFLFKLIGRKDLIYKLLMPLQIDKNEQTIKYLWKPKYSFKEGLKKILNEKIF